MWSPAESHKSLSHFEPASELSWKHDRSLRVKMETSCAVKVGKSRWYRGNMRFRPLSRMGTHVFI
jgi:hypothetical protein